MTKPWYRHDEAELAAIGAIEYHFKTTTDPYARQRVVRYAVSLAEGRNGRDLEIADALCRAFLWDPAARYRGLRCGR